MPAQEIEPTPCDLGVQWWAHRGTMLHQNTMRGIEAALAAGVDGVEVDLQISADVELFLFHDDDLDDLADGETHVGRARAYKWAQLEAMRVCGGESMPRLDALLAGWPAGRALNIELKAGGEALVSALEGALVTPAGVAARGDIVLSSFDPAMLRSAARLDLPRALLIEEPSPAWVHERGAESLAVKWVHLEACLVDAALLDRYAALGVQVGVWGAHDAAEEQALAGQGITRIISDFRVPAS